VKGNKELKPGVKQIQEAKQKEKLFKLLKQETESRPEHTSTGQKLPAQDILHI